MHPIVTLIRHLAISALVAGTSLLAQTTAQLPTGSRLRALVGTSDTPVAFAGGVLRTGFETMSDVADYELVAGREFNLFSPENVMKMKNLQANEGAWTFSKAEIAVQFAADQSASFHGHVLVGGQRTYNPSWIYTKTTATDVENAMNTHIDTVIGHWLPATGRPPVALWDVVNEAFQDSPSTTYAGDWTAGLRQNEPLQIWQDANDCHGAGYIDNPDYDVWVAMIGTSYIEKAFRRAHAADPNAILIYNDSSSGMDNNKTDYIYGMAQDFVNPSRPGGIVPIDGVGFQCHQKGDITSSSVRSNFDRFSQLGLSIFITELDWLADGSTDSVTNNDILDLQGRRYHNYLDAALRVPGFMGVQVWGIGDKYTWRYNTDPCAGAVHTMPQPLPFDENYNAKPAYYAMQDALAVQYRDQTLANAGFENGAVSPWVPRNGGTLAISTSTRNSGAYSVKITGRTAPNSGPSQDVTSAVLAQGAGRYFLRGWAKVPTGSATMKLTLRLQDDTQIAFKSIGPVTVGTGWTEVSGWLKVSWLKNLTSAILYAETTGASTTDFFLDDVMLSDGNLLTNAGFESGTTGWAPNFGGTLGSTDSTTDTSAGITTYHYGSKGVQVTSRGLPYHGVSQDVLAALLAGGKGAYALGGAMKLFPGSAAATGKITLRLRYDGVDHYSNVSGPVTADHWARLSGSMILDWTTLQQAVLYVETSTGTSSYYADDLVLRK